MAMMKYGRFSPKTTDPNTGARISDPDVYGQTIKGGGKVSSWPELRTMFQSGKLNEDFFGKGGTKAKPGKDSRYQLFPQEVKNYLEGKTDKLDDVNYEEPILTEDYAEMGSSRKRTFANLNYKVDSPKWKSAIKKATIPGEKYTPSEEGVNRQVDISVKEGYGETYGVSSIRKTKETTPTPPPPPPTKKESTPENVETTPKAVEIKPNQVKDLEVPSVPDATEWEAPKAKRYKTKREIVKSREGGQDRKIRPFKNELVPKKEGGVRKMPAFLVSKKREERQVAKGFKYEREEKAAKSFYAPKDDLGFGGYYQMTDEAFDEQGNAVNVAKLVKSKRKDIRESKQEFRQNTELKGAEKREGIKDYRLSMKTNREATREARQGKLMSWGDGKWKEGEGSRLKYFTPDYAKDSSGKLYGAMNNYVGSAESKIKRANALEDAQIANTINATFSKGSKQEGYIKAANDNAANRNTIINQMAQYKGWGKKIK